MRNDFIDIYDFLKDDYETDFVEKKVDNTNANIENAAHNFHLKCLEAFINSSTNFKNNLHIPSSYLNIITSPNKPPEESL